MSAIQLSNQQSLLSSTFPSRAIQCAKNVVSEPFDLCLGAMWTGYVVMSVKELAEYAFSNDENKDFTFSFSDREVSNHDFLSCASFATANGLKFIDWFGQSNISGATKVAFPYLSATADLFYVLSYGCWLFKSVKNISESHESSVLKDLDYSSQMFQKGKELASIADYAVNLSYMTFSALSLAAFVTGVTYLSTAIATSLICYFVFMGVRTFGDEAVNVFKSSARQVYWINSNLNSNQRQFV
ncbi:hypothetical protein COB11_00365 [Candidatus Aerophobetes bacterium]|uniref:Uncharacterized protein n=1 Tax=Aerophobetes bacterium TaxID=2030807 RepID=A0A2A4YN79_UNCAE|nr:MAG: hypothetical protein COB11_00365 [Candidatus Aerophobetes bacterium]